jgi:hypothetical protein
VTGAGKAEPGGEVEDDPRTAAVAVDVAYRLSKRNYDCMWFVQMKSMTADG